jgi:hypothetical protein
VRLTCLGQNGVLHGAVSVADRSIHERILEFMCVCLMGTADRQVSFKVGC